MGGFRKYIGGSLTRIAAGTACLGPTSALVGVVAEL